MSFISELLFYMQFLLTLPNLLISIKIFQTFLCVNLILIKARLEETEKGKNIVIIVIRYLFGDSTPNEFCISQPVTRTELKFPARSEGF